MNDNLPVNQLMTSFFNLATGETIFWFIAKLFFIAGFSLYLLFAVLIVRQVFMMTSTFRTSAEWVLKIIAFIHLFLAITVLVATFLIL